MCTNLHTESSNIKAKCYPPGPSSFFHCGPFFLFCSSTIDSSPAPHWSSRPQTPSSGGMVSCPTIYDLHPSRLCRWWTPQRSLFSHQSFSFSMSPSTLEVVGQPWSPHHHFCTLRVPLLIRLLPGAVFLFLSFELVCTVAATVLQGSCQWFVLRESAGLAFSISNR